MPRKKAAEPLDRTSSLNKYFLCHNCDKKFMTKLKLINHNCMSANRGFVCKWCNVKLQNKACLANHARNVHGDMCYSKLSTMRSSEMRKCAVCSKMFAELFQLRYHIRRQHFNLKAKLPYWLQKKVNQVWFEKVRNCNNVMEIRKASPNMLVMRKLAESSAIRVPDHDTEEIDVTHLYPTGRRYEPVECKICGKSYGKRDLNKHMEEVHYNKTRHRCNKCNLRFKRLYIFLQHACDARRKPRGVTQPRLGTHAGIRITTCESLATFNT